MNAKEIIAEVERHGAKFAVVENMLKVERANVLDESLKRATMLRKPEIMAELRRRALESTGAEVAGDRDTRSCILCLREQDYRLFDNAMLICAACREWRVTCPYFVIVKSAITTGESGACISCGGSWELHGKPRRDQWMIVDDADSVPVIEGRLVLAIAREILLGGRMTPCKPHHFT